MTPTAALTATAPELAPICASVMGPGWYVYDGPYCQMIHAPRGVDGDVMLEPWDDLADAFRLQERIAELGLQSRVCALLDSMLNNDPNMTCDYWAAVTASPLARTRACCAAWLESKENSQ